MITHTQRVKAALEGKILDRPAFAAWGPHMNLVDRDAKDFARRHHRLPERISL